MGRNLGVEYKMRMSQELKDKIAESAKELNRSMNADIVARLEQSFEEPITSEHEVNDLRELLKQSIENNNKYFQMIEELLKKSEEN
ncbi:Arc family DNA-binding protein [Acinetobacter johnsonii]|uniref:Arc family DNA-binding protein n=1 Tax=Acinetobacter johnsonii TaxID=40214 RepID=A0AA42LJ90_ACIJO|nr:MULTISPECIES: Arc family DNA-binding protein [Acinetobacter]MCL6243347.1 Arc family DNA-binding protein [Acinetobacter amyesii]MDH0657508.1 Arc family DNA-binding protein [Acinetobacter johnsonii]QQT57256.1 Arc family DNA-binding protein [Acinetobacter johnsonii]